jgi:hypothetical protein
MTKSSGPRDSMGDKTKRWQLIHKGSSNYSLWCSQEAVQRSDIPMLNDNALDCRCPYHRVKCESSTNDNCLTVAT